MEGRGALEQPGGGAEDQRVLQQLARSRAAGGERAGAAGRAAGEVLHAERRRLEPRGQLGLEPVEHVARREVVDDDATIGSEGRDHVVG